MKITIAIAITASLFSLDARAQAPAANLPINGSQRLLDAIKYSRTGERLLVESRIVGGKDTTIQQHPWQVALVAAETKEVVRGFFCGGSIYSARWIVTAAHCVDGGTTADQVNIVHSTHDLASGGQRLTVERIIVHPNWKKPGFAKSDYDVAVLRVAVDLPATMVGLISGAEEGAAVLPKTLLTVTGWGNTKEGGQISRTLKFVDIPFVPKDVCNNDLVYGGDITDRMLCAGSLEKQVGDSCQGDSGGPLTAIVNGKRVLAGIVSWGEGCNRINRPGVYSRVAILGDWVRENAK